MAAVHRDEVHVHVDQQVALGRPLVDLDVFAGVGQPDVQQVVGVLGVVVGELVGPEGKEHPLADGPADLGGGHPAVQRVGDDQFDVVDAGFGRPGQDRLDDALADVGQPHRRQRQADVVERDGELHARAQQFAQRRGVDRRVERGFDRGCRVVEAGKDLRRVDDAGAEREAFEAQALAGVHEQRRGSFVDLENEAGTGHERILPVLVGQFEDDAAGAEPAGGQRVVERVAPALERITPADQSIELRGSRPQVRAPPSCRRDRPRRRRPATARETRARSGRASWSAAR